MASGVFSISTVSVQNIICVDRFINASAVLSAEDHIMYIHHLCFLHRDEQLLRSRATNSETFQSTLLLARERAS